MIGGHRALRLLARRKFIGFLRKQARRVKTPSGALLALVGLGAILLWIASLTLSFWTGGGPRGGTTLKPEFARALGASIALLAMVTALSFRGLYLPREEIELLFSAPVSRSDVIRYRLWTALGKSLFGATFFAVIVSTYASSRGFAFVAAFAFMMTIPLATQIVSIVAGDAENRWIRRIPRGLLRFVSVLGVLALIAVFLSQPRPSNGAEIPDLKGLVDRVMGSPVVQGLALPLWPWVAAATAASWAQFLPWLGLCLAVWWCLFEACARLPVDYRELSLETSADVARRLNRLRRGSAGAAASTADARAAGWRVPWLFGRTPFGALAWRKTGTILRKARGTLLISGAVVLLLVIASVLIFRDQSAPSALASSAGIAVFGQIYLCAGLRFDFREDLERMDVVRSWPVAGWRVFLATILPEVVLVVAVLAIAILVRTAIAGSFPIGVWIVLLALGPCVLAWVAIDNAVFLVWPVRMTPGQEGLLQQAGRSLMLVLVRVMTVGVVAAVVAVVGLLVWYVTREGMGLSHAVSVSLAGGLGVLFLIAECVVLVHVGGRLLGRFDVARDR